MAKSKVDLRFYENFFVSNLVSMPELVGRMERK